MLAELNLHCQVYCAGNQKRTVRGSIQAYTQPTIITIMFSQQLWSWNPEHSLRLTHSVRTGILQLAVSIQAWSYKPPTKNVLHTSYPTPVCTDFGLQQSPERSKPQIHSDLHLPAHFYPYSIHPSQPDWHPLSMLPHQVLRVVSRPQPCPSAQNVLFSSFKNMFAPGVGSACL